VASATLTNFSQPDNKAAITLPLKVGYEAVPALVLATLTASAREVPEVIASPTPLAYILGYDDLGVSYLLKFWIQDYQRKFSITTEVGRRVWYKFKRLGIAIPMPVSGQLARVLETVDKGGAEEAAGKAVEQNLVDLLNSSFLRHQEGDLTGQAILTDAEARELAGLVQRVVFTPGETLFWQGEKGEACYVVARGKIKGLITTEEAGKSFHSEFHTGAGGIVGEMSLFTGMPRTATVTVEEESEFLEIGAAAFVELLSRNPGLADVVAEIVSLRNRNNLESLRKIKELSAVDLEAGSNKKTVLEYLRKLVGLFKK
jgi:CRP-like cAMP-binding protein